MRGFKNPSGDLPALMRTSFNNATNAARAGADADVPSAEKAWPWKKIRKFSDCAERSGTACDTEG